MFTKINDSKIWQNGKFLDWQNSSVHSLTHTLHYGVGVFEGVRAYKGDQGTAIFRLQDHTDRLFKAAEIVNIKIPYSKEELNKIQCEILHQNRLQYKQHHDISKYYSAKWFRCFKKVCKIQFPLWVNFELLY